MAVNAQFDELAAHLLVAAVLVGAVALQLDERIGLGSVFFGGMLFHGGKGMEWRIYA